MTEAKHYNSAGSLVLTVDYSYDAFGELVKENDGTTVTEFAKDGWNPALPTPFGNENMNT